MKTVDDIEMFFRYVTLGNFDLEKMGQVRAMGLEFSRVILDVVPEGDGKEEALKAVRVAVLQANSEIGFAASKRRGL